MNGTCVSIINLILCMMPCFVVAAEPQLRGKKQQPSIQEQQKPVPTEEQKRQWEADAQTYARIASALGGKMLHDNPEIKPAKL
jgi:hypothetical protein